MADEQDFEVDGKSLSLLRVVDLKQELEKRGLSKSGSKKDLVDRLKGQLQIERLQQSATQDEGHVPNLALQDDAIGGQSDVIKEYLAQQQQIYEIQKETRRRIQMEEEKRQNQLEEGTDGQEIAESGETNRSMSPVKSSNDITDSSLNQEEKLPSKSETILPERKENVSSGKLEEESAEIPPTDIKPTEAEQEEKMDLSVKKGAGDKGGPAVGRRRGASAASAPLEEPESDTKQGKTGRKKGEQVSEVEAKEDVSTGRASPERVQGGDRNARSGGTDEKTKDENYPEQSKSTTRSLRPRLRREVFHVEPEVKQLQSEKSEAKSSAESKKPAEKVVQPTTEKQSEDEEDEEKVRAEALRSRLRARPKITREEISSSSSSSRSRSPSDKKTERNRDGSSNSSSGDDDSPSESVSSSGSPKKTSRFKGRSDRQSKKEEEMPKSSESKEEVKESEKVEDTSAPLPKRTRLNRSQSRTPEAETWQRRTAATSDIADDVIDTQPEEEEMETKAFDSKTEKQTNKTEVRESMEVDNNRDEVGELAGSETEKVEAAKPTTRVQMRKLSLSSSKEGAQNKENVESSSEGEKVVRKRKWGSTTVKTVKKTSIAISTDSLKSLIPDVKPLASLMASDNALDLNEGPPSDAEDSRDDENQDATANEVRIVRTVTQIVMDDVKDAASTDAKKLDAGRKMVTKPISLMEEPVGREGSPSPARNVPNRIIHIRNLVRPFTINQLKELLGRTGNLVEGGFWTDKIKSKCYATYETQDQAIDTRRALHGTQWPPSNRKNLIVDFADEDELQFHMSLNDVVEVPKQTRDSEQPPLAVQREQVMRRNRDQAVVAKPSGPPTKGRENVQPVQPTLPPPIREWDRVKIGERSPGERERRKRAVSPPGRGDRNKKERSRDGRDKRDKRDRRKEEEEAPAKLLDDLFKKTKSTPCIYWLPLTIDQIKQRDDDRKVRQVEREKRRQQVKKEVAVGATAGTEKESKGPTTQHRLSGGGGGGGGGDAKPKKRVDENRSRKRSSSSPPRSRPRRR